MTKDIGEIKTSQQFTGLTTKQLFALKEYKTVLEMEGLKGKLVCHVNTTGKELQDICKINNWDPQKPADYIMMIDTAAHYDVLKALDKGIRRRKIIAEMKVSK